MHREHVVTIASLFFLLAAAADIIAVDEACNTLKCYDELHCTSDIAEDGTMCRPSNDFYESSLYRYQCHGGACVPNVRPERYDIGEISLAIDSGTPTITVTNNWHHPLDTRIRFFCSGAGDGPGEARSGYSEKFETIVEQWDPTSEYMIELPAWRHRINGEIECHCSVSSRTGDIATWKGRKFGPNNWSLVCSGYVYDEHENIVLIPLYENQPCAGGTCRGGLCVR